MNSFGTLTRQQYRTLEVIANLIDEHGYSPTVREITDALGLRSPGSTSALLDALEAKGYITSKAMAPRTIRLADGAEEYVA